MFFIERFFFYCVLYSECPLSEVPLYLIFIHTSINGEETFGENMSTNQRQ